MSRGTFAFRFKDPRRVVCTQSELNVRRFTPEHRVLYRLKRFQSVELSTTRMWRQKFHGPKTYALYGTGILDYNHINLRRALIITHDTDPYRRA